MGGREKPYGSSTNVLNYKSGGRASGLPGGAVGRSSLLESIMVHNSASHGKI